jgi:3',5'-cyclic AMP phosphodiesterase CpdA
MPGLFDTPMSRKKFLAASAGAAGAWCAPAGIATAEESPPPARLALLSDTHIPKVASDGNRGFIPVENLRKVVEQVVSVPGQAAVLNGDAARLVGEVDDYLVLREQLQRVADEMPIHIGLGNHDDRKNFFKVFPQDPGREELVQGKHVSMFSLCGTRFVVLDSLLYVNKVAGLLGKTQRTWLERFLSQSDDRPVVFFVHHTLGDGDGDLLDFERAFDLMKPHKKVKAIFYGHSHAYRIDQRDHIYLINQPAIGYNFNDTQPVGWLDASFAPSGVALTLHAVGGNMAGDGETTTIDWS